MATLGPDMPAHLKAIVICERVGAVISLMGVLLIFLAFGSFKRLRTVPNTFIVFASFANLGASIACVIGYSGVLAGSTSPLCQAQAFMFELFMQSDPWWSLAMAVNVFMVFFCAANPNNLLRYWYLYFLVCYGVPFIPALALLVLRNDHGNVYGNATIWCWIDKDWSGLRIYTYYLPIWVCLVLSLCIYIAVGYRVFKQRNQLRNLSLSTRMRDMPTDSRDSGEKELSGNAAVMGTATIREEVLTTTTINTLSEPMPVYLGDGGGRHDVGSWIKGPAESSSLAYSSDQAHIHPALRRAGPHHQRVATPGAAVTTSITAEPRARQTFRQRVHGFFARVAARITNMDPVKWAYLRTSFVFAVTVLVTWTPSSINRIHDMVRPDEFSFGLSLASSIVLPLQGTWNAVIFFYTSWGPLREEVRTWVDFYFLGVPVGQGAADAVRRERDVDNNNRHVDTYEDDDGVRSEISGEWIMAGPPRRRSSWHEMYPREDGPFGYFTSPLYTYRRLLRPRPASVISMPTTTTTTTTTATTSAAPTFSYAVCDGIGHDHVNGVCPYATGPPGPSSSSTSTSTRGEVETAAVREQGV